METREQGCGLLVFVPFTQPAGGPWSKRPGVLGGRWQQSCLGKSQELP